MNLRSGEIRNAELCKTRSRIGELDPPYIASWARRFSPMPLADLHPKLGDTIRRRSGAWNARGRTVTGHTPTGGQASDQVGKGTPRPVHDVTTGANTMTFPAQPITGYQAGPGWDPVTGWGSPNAQALIPLLTRSQT